MGVGTIDLLPGKPMIEHAPLVCAVTIFARDLRRQLATVPHRRGAHDIGDAKPMGECLEIEEMRGRGDDDPPPGGPLRRNARDSAGVNIVRHAALGIGGCKVRHDVQIDRTSEHQPLHGLFESFAGQKPRFVSRHETDDQRGEGEPPRRAATRGKNQERRPSAVHGERPVEIEDRQRAG